MPSPNKKLFIIQCNPFSLARCVTSKKFRCQHNKENLRLVSAHILWGARPDSESWVRTFKCGELLSLNSWKTFWATKIFSFFISIYSFSGGNTFYHLRWYKTEKNELKGNEVIRKKCGTIFGDIYKLLEANKNCYQLEQSSQRGSVSVSSSRDAGGSRWIPSCGMKTDDLKWSRDNETSTRRIIKHIMSARWNNVFKDLCLFIFSCADRSCRKEKGSGFIHDQQSEGISLAVTFMGWWVVITNAQNKV